jgi:cholest-4-en-3-one 26-monooxygenase
MIDMDPPAHRKRRRLVSGAFTPARVRATADGIRATCDELIDAFSERGECDLRHDLAAPLPLIVICDMLGVPPEDRDAMLRWSDALLGSLNGGADAMEAAAASFGKYAEYAQSMIEDRRAHPSNDLVSVLVHDKIDGERLRDDEIMFEALLLLLGGDETTRNVTCSGVEALLAHPEQWQQLLDDPGLLASAVEEALRWASPIKNMKRTVTHDLEFRGQQLREGDQALLLYESANFDEAQFDEPNRFDVTRSPNEHIAFGFGAHFCVGAHLARLELHSVFERIVTRLPDLELATDGPPPRSLTGISEMPVRFSPTRRLSAERFVQFRGEPGGQLGPDLDVPPEERTLVEPSPAEPAGHFVVALAGVARATRRDDVVERVAAATRDREDAVALQWNVGGAAVGAAAPGLLRGAPLLVAEVVLDAIHPALAAPSRPDLATSSPRHGS